jgi:hypothetical protein
MLIGKNKSIQKFHPKKKIKSTITMIKINYNENNNKNTFENYVKLKEKKLIYEQLIKFFKETTTQSVKKNKY